MNNISFQSRLRPVTKPEFDNAIKSFHIDGSCNYPWTIRQAVYSNKVYTRGICDCVACLIKGCEKSLLLHLCPDMDENKNFEKIFNFIKQKINICKDHTEAFLTGSGDNKESKELYEKFKEFLNKHKIPTTELREANDTIAVAYRNDNDEILISLGRGYDKVASLKLKGLSDKDIIDNSFKKVAVAECDEY